MNQLNIAFLSDDTVIQYAAAELKKYLERIIKENIQVTVQQQTDYKESSDNIIWLGEMDAFNVDLKVECAELDDAIHVDITEGHGIICGSNARSVLLGVYQFVNELGGRWIRPGADGEILVQRGLSEINVKLTEKPSYRHRGIVIEGATSLENVMDIVEWAPKLGFNSFFMQFREGYVFFERWYKHINNPNKAPEHFDMEMAAAYTQQIKAAIKDRGMIYHAVGHGWTAEAMGVHDVGWEVKEFEFSEKERQYLSLINGERKMWNSVISNTNLCYSNVEVRERMVNSMVQYLENEGEGIDYLHFWLADENNNHCECEECKKKRPADFYIMMLNELDKKLTAKNINTKIVFLAYLDLLWAPETERLNNQDRFILMFAPITRTFTQTYNIDESEVRVKEYTRNKIVFPKEIGEHIGYLREWQKLYEGDSFDFDYPLGRAHFGEPGYYKISEVIYEDIKHLKKHGLNGYLSCQELRAFFPTGLPNYVMGKTLWNKDIAFNDIVKDYFYNAFGTDWELCVQYVKDISEHFSLHYYYNEIRGVHPELRSKFEGIEDIIDSFIPVIEQNIENDNRVWRQSWEYLKYHTEYCRLFSKVLVHRASGNEKQMKEAWGDLISYIQRIEDNIQKVYDVFRFIQLGELNFINNMS